MQKELTIEGRKVLFKATAVTPIRYQERYGRDFLKDIQSYQKTAEGGEVLSTDILVMCMRLAHTMAIQADGTIPEDPYEWVDGFDTFPIDVIMPELIDLWMRSTISSAQLKKKARA